MVSILKYPDTTRYVGIFIKISKYWLTTGWFFFNVMKLIDG